MAIIVPIGVDTKGLQRGLTGARGQLARFGKIAAVAAGAAALGGLVKTIQIGTEEFMEQQKVAAQTGAVLKSTGGIAKVTADEISTLAESLMRKSGVDDEAIQSGQNLLLTFTKIRNEQGKGNDIFNQATRAMLDLSVAMGKDLPSSAILVGKALNDPIRGATALTRAGVQLTEGQRNQIKAFVESGRVMDAQKIILRELTTQFGGSAAAVGKTLPGQLNILRQTFSNLAGELVARFMPAVANAATRLVGFLREFADQPTLRARIEFVIGRFADIAWTGITSIYQWWNRETRRVELPARVVFTAPGGRQQVEELIDSLAPAARASGRRVGRAAAEGLLAGSSEELGRRLRGSFTSSLLTLLDPIGATGRFLGKNLIGPFISGFVEDFVPRMAQAIAEGLRRAFSMGLDMAANGIRGTLGRALDLVPGRSPRMARAFKKVITASMREAVQASRRELQSLGATIAGFVSDLLGETSPEAIRLKEIRKQQKKEEAAREEADLRRRIAESETAEERADAQRDLDDFLLEQEAQRLEDSIEQQQNANARAIDDLVESFNRGELSAEQFSAALEDIIGPNRGAELGIGFAGAFGRAIEDLIARVKDIFAIVGTGVPIAGGGAAPVRESAEAAYQEALEDWKNRRDNRRKQATDFRKREASDGGTKITEREKKEIEDIMRAWNKRNPRPQRAAYGLAMGGILKKTVFAAGEAGPEAVIPLESPSAMSMLSEALNGGGRRGGGGDIYLTVNAGLGTNPDELSRVIVDSIKRYERRNGQVFSGPLVQSTTTAAGVASTASGASDFNFIKAARRG
jgi:hypothetical protein